MSDKISASEAIETATRELDRWIGQVVAVFNYLEANRGRMNFGDAIGVLFQLQVQFTSKDKMYIEDKRLKKLIADQCPDFVKYGQAKGQIDALTNDHNSNDDARSILQTLGQEMSHVEDVVHQIKYDESCADRSTGDINFRQSIQKLNGLRQRLHEVTSEALASLGHASLASTSKAVRLWQIGGFWLFAFSVVFGAIFVLVIHSVEWWHLCFALIGLEVVLVLLGAFTLRTVGDVSEQTFLSLIAIAFREQFKVFTILKGLFSKRAEGEIKTQEGDKPKSS